jgi:hypothetical protein
MFDHAVEEQLLKPENRALVLARDRPADLLQTLDESRPSHVGNLALSSCISAVWSSCARNSIPRSLTSKNFENLQLL